MKKLIYLMLSLTVLAACSPSGDGGINGIGGSDSDKTKKTVMIQGMTPTDYYNQFLFKDSTDCGRSDSYKFLSSWSISLVDRVNGHETVGNLYLFLNADGTYYAEYKSDEIVEVSQEGAYWSRRILRETIQGKWSVTEDGEIILGQLGRGKSLIYNDMPAIDLALGGYFADKGIRYNSLVLTMATANHGKRNNPRCPSGLD